MQRAAGVKVEEEQGCLGVDREVAEGVEEVVARVIPPPEPVAFDAANPGAPPRWEASEPRSGLVVPRKNVSAARISPVSAGDRTSARLAPPAPAWPGLPGARRRWWMYCGQLP